MAVPTPTLPATGVAMVNGTGQQVASTTTGGTVQTVVSTLPAEPAIGTPAIPASTVTATNANAFPVLVAITGGTTTVIAVNGVTVATTTPANVVVPPAGTIAITYTVVPTSWTWTAIYAGASGNPLASGTTIPVPPGGNAAVYYTAAPALAWTDPQEMGYTPGYSTMNTAAEFPGYNPLTAMPLSPHATGGLTGFATGVSN